MSWLRFLARSYGIDALIVLGAVISALIVILGGQTENAPTSPLWFAAPAVAVVVLPLLWRRRFPFVGPASVWLIAAVLSFVDGRLVVFPVTVYIAGMAAAYLLGNLADGARAGFGLVVVLVAITIIIVNSPDHAAGDYVAPRLVRGRVAGRIRLARPRGASRGGGSTGDAVGTDARARRASGDRRGAGPHRARAARRGRAQRECHDRADVGGAKTAPPAPWSSSPTATTPSRPTTRCASSWVTWRRTGRPGACRWVRCPSMPSGNWPRTPTSTRRNCIG